MKELNPPVEPPTGRHPERSKAPGTSAGQKFSAANRPTQNADGRLSTRWLVLLILVCAGPAVYVLHLGGFTSEGMLGAFLFAALMVTTELAVNTARTAGRPASMHPTEALLAAALLWSPGTWILAGVIIGSVVTRCIWRRGPLIAAWVAARNALATSAALLVSLLAPGNPSFVLMGLLVGTTMRYLLIRLAERREHEDPARNREARIEIFGHSLVVASIGLLIGHFLITDPQWIVVCSVLAIPLVRAYTKSVSARADRGLLRELLSHLHSSTDNGPEAAAELILIGAETIFASPQTRVVVTIFDPQGPWTLTRSEQGVITRAASGSLATSARTVLALGDGPVVVGSTPAGSTFTGVMGDPAAPLGLLDVVWSGSPFLEKAEKEQTGRLLVEHASSWLRAAFNVRRAERAERAAQNAAQDVQALAQLGNEAHPAMNTLRDVTQRIATLPQGGADARVVEMVGDLHRAGEAVATLIGAARASSGAPADQQGPQGAGRRPHTSSPAPAVRRAEGSPRTVSLGVMLHEH